MKFVIARDTLLKPLNLVAGVVERRHTLPILANILLVLEGDQLSLTGTDLEVELVGRVKLDKTGDAGEVTVPARKLVDICKSLPEGCDIEISIADEKAVVKSGRSRFTLATRAASDFPNVEDSEGLHTITLLQSQLRHLIERTSFAMAQQDVRYYLNGMLLELRKGHLRVVATDGHRLAMCTQEGDFPLDGKDESKQVILPRKGVLELARLLQDDGEEVTLVIGNNHVRASTEEFTFTSKLVDGKFPDYERVLPKSLEKNVIGTREELRQAFTRAAILSNEKYRGVRFQLSSGSLVITANNPEQEEAEETVSVEYEGDNLEIGFNVSYLQDVLGALDEEKVRMSMSDSGGSALLEEAEGGDALYVVMPMRL